MILSFHVTHSSAGADRIADIIPKLNKHVDDFIRSQSQISEYVILSTCNRFEIYAETNDVEATNDAFERFADLTIKERNAWFELSGNSSVRHLFRVSCGLDSLVVGEDQIQGQVRSAYISAKEKDNAARTMTKIFDRALQVGKRVRTETELNRGSISVGSVAVELAENKLGGLSGKTVAVLGAGEMATAVARNLSDKGLHAIFVSSRTFERAKTLADELNGTAVRFNKISDVLRDADLFVVATSAPHILIDRKMVETTMIGRDRRLMIIDISVPRNVSDDVSKLPGVDVETMEGIGSRASKNLMNRFDEISKAEAIIDLELRRMEEDEREQIANGVICEIAKKTSGIRQEELSIALSKMERGIDPEQIFDDFSRVLIAKIMAEPYEKLREASRSGRTDMCEMATALFGVDMK